jgi:hypothetical protein
VPVCSSGTCQCQCAVTAPDCCRSRSEAWVKLELIVELVAALRIFLRRKQVKSEKISSNSHVLPGQRFCTGLLTQPSALVPTPAANPIAAQQAKPKTIAFRIALPPTLSARLYHLSRKAFRNNGDNHSRLANRQVSKQSAKRQGLRLHVGESCRELLRRLDSFNRRG